VTTAILCHLSRGRRASAFGLTLLLGLLARPAAAAPLATTTVTCLASTTGDPHTPIEVGPLPLGLSTSCDAADSGVDIVGRPFQNAAAGDADTGLGPGPPRVGVADVSASAQRLGGVVTKSASVLVNAHVVYYLEIQEFKVAPFPVPMFPTYFEARGEGTANGHGNTHAYFLARASLGEEVVFSVEGNSLENPSDEFDKQARIQLEPKGPANPFYTIELVAGCTAFAAGNDPELGDGADCSATVDPVVRFDQETFDALYGSASFPLEDYYRFEFSENVPEPAHALLVLTGGLVLAAAGRQRRA
jgi:hypothetical protein